MIVVRLKVVGLVRLAARPVILRKAHARCTSAWHAPPVSITLCYAAVINAVQECTNGRSQHALGVFPVSRMTSEVAIEHNHTGRTNRDQENPYAAPIIQKEPESFLNHSSAFEW